MNGNGNYCKAILRKEEKNHKFNNDKVVKLNRRINDFKKREVCSISRKHAKSCRLNTILSFTKIANQCNVDFIFMHCKRIFVCLYITTFLVLFVYFVYFANTSLNLNLGAIFIAINSWKRSFAAYGMVILITFSLLLHVLHQPL